MSNTNDIRTLISIFDDLSLNSKERLQYITDNLSNTEIIQFIQDFHSVKGISIFKKDNNGLVNRLSSLIKYEYKPTFKVSVDDLEVGKDIEKWRFLNVL